MDAANDYLQFWQDAYGPEVLAEVDPWERQMKILEAARFDPTQSPYFKRSIAIARWGFAVPGQRAIETCVKYSPLVEMGAGLGYWAKLIEDAGGDVICYDKHPPGVDSKNQWWGLYGERAFDAKPLLEPYHEICRGTPAQLGQYKDRTLLLIWPGMDTMAQRSIYQYEGDHVIYVGESEGGCNASSGFFAALREEFELVESIGIPQWYGLHDYMEVWRRKRQ